VAAFECLFCGGEPVPPRPAPQLEVRADAAAVANALLANTIQSLEGVISPAERDGRNDRLWQAASAGGATPAVLALVVRGAFRK